MGKKAEYGNEDKGDEHNRPDPQADPERGPNSEKGPRGDGEGGDDELEEQHGDAKLLEVVPRGVRLGAPFVGLRRCLLQGERLGVRITPSVELRAAL